MPETFFDHSALNRVFEAGRQQRAAILTGLRQLGRIRITTLNVIEAAARTDGDERRAKLEFYRELTGSMNPADPPNEVLVKTAMAFLEGRPTIDLGSDEAWRLLHDPGVLTDELRADELAFTQGRATSFRTMHEELRGTFQQHFERVPSDRAGSACALIAYFCERIDSYLDNLLVPAFERATGVNPGRDKVREFIDGCDAWRLYWSARVHALYARAVREQGYGHKKNAGLPDLEASIYLAFADYFVTFDRAQHAALCDVNSFNRRDTKVIWFGDLLI